MQKAMDNDLDEARQHVENIRARLPCSISFADLGVQSQPEFIGELKGASHRSG
jgi:hypothetical protein